MNSTRRIPQNWTYHESSFANPVDLALDWVGWPWLTETVQYGWCLMHMNVPVAAVIKCEKLGIRSHAYLRDPSYDKPCFFASFILKDSKILV